MSRHYQHGNSHGNAFLNLLFLCCICFVLQLVATVTNCHKYSVLKQQTWFYGFEGHMSKMSPMGLRRYYPQGQGPSGAPQDHGFSLLFQRLELQSLAHRPFLHLLIQEGSIVSLFLMNVFVLFDGNSFLQLPQVALVLLSFINLITLLSKMICR